MITAFIAWCESQAKPTYGWNMVYVGTILIDVVGMAITYDTIKLFIGA